VAAALIMFEVIRRKDEV